MGVQGNGLQRRSWRWRGKLREDISMMARHPVLFAADSPLALPTGGGRTRILAEIRNVSDRAFDPSLVCFVSMEQMLRHGRRLLSSRRHLESEAGCPVTYLPQLPFSRFSWIGKANDWLKTKAVQRYAARRRAGIVHTHSLGTAIASIRARAGKRQLRVIADIHGAAPEEYLESIGGTVPNTTFRHLSDRERTVVSMADGLIVVSEELREHLESKHGIEARHVLVLPCCTDVERFPVPNGETSDLARTALGANGRPVVCYLGSTESYQMPSKMCSIFNSVAREIDGAFFLVISHGGDVIEKELIRLGLDRKHYAIRAANSGQVPWFLAAADVGLVIRADSAVNRVAFPTKLAEYLASGVPVVTTPYVGDASKLVMTNDCGLVVHPEDPEIGAKVSGFLASVVRNRPSYAETCRKVAEEHLDWKSVGDRIATEYRRVLKA